MLILDKKICRNAYKKSYQNERVEIIEMDQLYTFVKRKKQNLRDAPRQ